jgi:hypothetical protein
MLVSLYLSAVPLVTVIVSLSCAGAKFVTAKPLLAAFAFSAL